MEQPLDDLFFLHLKSEEDDAEDDMSDAEAGDDAPRCAHVG